MKAEGKDLRPAGLFSTVGISKSLRDILAESNPAQSDHPFVERLLLRLAGWPVVGPLLGSFSHTIPVLDATSEETILCVAARRPRGLD